MAILAILVLLDSMAILNVLVLLDRMVILGVLVILDLMVILGLLVLLDLTVILDVLVLLDSMVILGVHVLLDSMVILGILVLLDLTAILGVIVFQDINSFNFQHFFHRPHQTARSLVMQRVSNSRVRDRLGFRHSGLGLGLDCVLASDSAGFGFFVRFLYLVFYHKLALRFGLGNG